MRRYRVNLARVCVGLLFIVGAVIPAQSAAAITGGQRDTVHTNVGVIRFTTESGRFRCSGTLISPTVVLTAGHCTGDTGQSPATNVFANQGALKDETFTLVGYGVDIGPKKEQIVITERRSTTSFLKNVQDEVVVFQINDRDSKAGGGSCFGDSGGPVFLGRYVIGDASYVNSLACNATGSYQRVDTPYARAFLEQFI